MSLAMGIMITYGSYMKKDVDLEKSVHQIEYFDTGFALIAGLMIVPGVAVYSGVENLDSSGPALMFQVLPQVFDNMPMGHLIGGLFFILVLFAALTSSISLMETVVSIFQDKLTISRRLLVVLVTIGTFAIGLLSSLGFGPLSFIEPLGAGTSLLDFFRFYQQQCHHADRRTAYLYFCRICHQNQSDFPTRSKFRPNPLGKIILL